MLLIGLEVKKIIFTIPNNYIFVNPVKLLFLSYIFFKFVERARATLRGLAGHRLGTADLIAYHSSSFHS